MRGGAKRNFLKTACAAELFRLRGVAICNETQRDVIYFGNRRGVSRIAGGERANPEKGEDNAIHPDAPRLRARSPRTVDRRRNRRIPPRQAPGDVRGKPERRPRLRAVLQIRRRRLRPDFGPRKRPRKNPHGCQKQRRRSLEPRILLEGPEPEKVGALRRARKCREKVFRGH